VKELLKSVHIWKSYRKNKSGTFFMAHGVEFVYIWNRVYKWIWVKSLVEIKILQGSVVTQR